MVAVVETIDVQRTDGIVRITLTRPEKKNAINGTMWDELLATFREIGASSADRAVVITGSGGAFCSGADLTASGDGPPRHQLAAMRHVGDVCLALHRLPQPVIAKVRGVAVGAGLNLALGCDLVVASDNARFSQIFAKRGLSIDFGGSWVLPRRVGLHRAKELAFFADIIDAVPPGGLVLCNPPYVPVTAEADEPAPPAWAGPRQAWDGGEDGRRVLDPLCAAAPEMLSDGGTLLVVQSEYAGIDDSLGRLRDAGLQAKIVAAHTIPFGPVLFSVADGLQSAGRLAPGPRRAASTASFTQLVAPDRSRDLGSAGVRHRRRRCRCLCRQLRRGWRIGDERGPGSGPRQYSRICSEEFLRQ